MEKNSKNRQPLCPLDFNPLIKERKDAQFLVCMNAACPHKEKCQKPQAENER